MLMLLLSFALNAQAEGTGVGITPIVELSHPLSHRAINSGKLLSWQAFQAH
jgi:hypothetical protein